MALDTIHVNGPFKHGSHKWQQRPRAGNDERETEGRDEELMDQQPRIITKLNPSKRRFPQSSVQQRGGKLALRTPSPLISQLSHIGREQGTTVPVDAHLVLILDALGALGGHLQLRHVEIGLGLRYRRSFTHHRRAICTTP